MELKSKKRGAVIRWALRIFLTAACVAVLVFIFSNSLKTGEKSAQQSSVMVDVVQDVAALVAPNSGIANATGAAYDRLHMWVRVFAHFAEFLLFGALLLWCIVSYTWREKAVWLSVFGVLLVPLIDETLQHFVNDRGAEIYDVFVDVVGGICGILFAVLTLLVALAGGEERRRKKTAKAKNKP